MDQANPAEVSRTVLASFASYDEAREAIDRLADQKFPIEELAIVAHDLEVIEDVTGRRGFAEAALAGLVSGIITGGLIGFFLGLFSLSDPIGLAFPLAFQAAALGALIGLGVGLIGRAISAEHGKFSSVQSLRAGRYDVMVTAPFAETAREGLLTAGLIRAR